MDRRVALLRELSKDAAASLRPQHNTESPCGYVYARAQRVFRTRPGGEVEMLDHLADLGYLAREFADVIHLCPRCRWFTLNFREECPACASANLTVVAMIHHFKCGYVAPEQEFQAGHEYACPKCLTTLQHVGVDYERPTTNHLCGSCKQVFRDPDVFCLCLTCGDVAHASATIVRQLSAYRLTPKGLHAAELGEIEEAGPQTVFVEPTLGVYTWPFFMEELNLEIARAGRFQFPLSVLMVRVEPAEGAAPRPGTATGQTAIREAGLKLKETLRATDLVAARGENVYGALLPGTGEDAALLVAERVQHALAAPWPTPEGTPMRVTTAIVCLSMEVSTSTDLVAAAETRLDQAVRASHPAGIEG